MECSDAHLQRTPFQTYEDQVEGNKPAAFDAAVAAAAAEGSTSPKESIIFLPLSFAS